MPAISTQDRNSAQVALLSADFQNRYEPNFALANAVSTYMALPGLRGFWPMSGMAYTEPRCRDPSGNGNHLITNNTPQFGYDNLRPIVDLDGVNQSMYKASRCWRG